MKTITINVTQDHINAGKPCDSWHCPIALALLDGDLDSVCVRAGNRVTFHINGDVLEGVLPRAAQNFIRAFDSRRPPLHSLLPFSFELEYSPLVKELVGDK